MKRKSNYQRTQNILAQARGEAAALNQGRLNAGMFEGKNVCFLYNGKNANRQVYH